MKIRILDIVRGTTVDGPGFRTSIYFAGCRHKCLGCHNPQSWDFDAGQDMDIDEIMDIVREEDFNVTFSGGDPLYHPDEVVELSRRIVLEHHNVWLYTGFTVEQILDDDKLRCALRYIDTVVDGPFIEALRDPDLTFRGSSNQRIIPVSSLDVGGQ